MKDSFVLRPFYLKAINSIREIVKVEMELPHLYHSYIVTFNEVKYFD
jgi:hypothetical protein